MTVCGQFGRLNEMYASKPSNHERISMAKPKRELTYTGIKDFKKMKTYKKNGKKRLKVSFIGMKEQIVIPGIITAVYYDENKKGMTIVVKD